MRNTFVFATVVCLVCSVLLALAAGLLKPYQDYNVAIDKKKNILKALSLYESGSTLTSSEIESLYDENILEYVIDASGKKVEQSISELEKGSQLLPVYERKDNNYVALPVEGMGLWSLLQGYFALKADRHTVAGVTFYEQKETAGLGAEIAKDWFVNNFKDKDILDSKGKLVSVSVAKGKAADATGIDIKNCVDGISGATMTGRGVNNLLKKAVKAYRPFLEEKWN